MGQELSEGQEVWFFTEPRFEELNFQVKLLCGVIKEISVRDEYPRVDIYVESRKKCSNKGYYIRYLSDVFKTRKAALESLEECE